MWKVAAYLSDIISEWKFDIKQILEKNQWKKTLIEELAGYGGDGIAKLTELFCETACETALKASMKIGWTVWTNGK